MQLWNLNGLKHKVTNLVLLLPLLLAVILPVGYAAINVTPVKALGQTWYDGSIQYSTITNCVSIIQGSPYQEYGAGTYVGFLADPDNASPAFRRQPASCRLPSSRIPPPDRPS